MKAFPISLKYTLLLSLGILLFPFFSRAQSSADKAYIKKLVESGNYVFHAHTALPLTGSAIQLTSDFTLNISKDTITTHLPYYGRDYIAPMDPAQGGIQISSSSFDYTLTPRRIGGWFVNIKPNRNRDVQHMSLSISATGNASLQVISTNRQTISFMGYITPAPSRS